MSILSFALKKQVREDTVTPNSYHVIVSDGFRESVFLTPYLYLWAGELESLNENTRFLV